jgi:hypothetical protein
MNDDDAQTAADFLITKHGSDALHVASTRAEKLAKEG